MSHKGTFLIGTPIGRSVCPVGNRCGYSIMQGKRQFCLLWLMTSVRVWVLMINHQPKMDQSIPYFVLLYPLEHTKFFSFILQATQSGNLL